LYYPSEFTLNAKADAFDCFDALLSVLHATFAIKPSENEERHALIRRECRECPVHQTFHLSIDFYQECQCGKKSPLTSFDRNLFDCQLNTCEVLKEIAKQDIYSAKHKLIEMVYKQSLETQEGFCVDGEKGKNHVTQSRKVLVNAPTVFTFNLGWSQGQPRKIDILRILTAVPNWFSPDKLFTLTGQQKTIPVY
jgi:hypothetical protein